MRLLAIAVAAALAPSRVAAGGFDGWSSCGAVVEHRLQVTDATAAADKWGGGGMMAVHASGNTNMHSTLLSDGGWNLKAYNPCSGQIFHSDAGSLNVRAHAKA